MDDAKAQPQVTNPMSQTGKRPYSAPQLTVHGTVAQLTEGISGANTDQQGGSAPG